MACVALCLASAGCASIGQTFGTSARASNRDISVAVESIEGLPRDMQQTFLRDLSEEAAALRIAVAPAGGEAAYRLRGYLAAHGEGAATSIAWAFDVYDGDLHRAFRLSGEERAAKGKGWAAADEALLRRLAHSGLEQLAGFAAAPPTPAAPAAPPPERTGAVVASSDDVRTAATTGR
ncbi:MAG TPA: hypothetical protein VIY51_00905 [Xanthobacteraceae bacterium]